MTDVLDLTFRDVRDGQLVIYHNRSIAKVMKDGTMIADAKEVFKNPTILETLDVSRAMFVVEREKDFVDILDWRKVAEFRKLTINCYFLFTNKWLLEALRTASENLRYLRELEITGTHKIDSVTFGEIMELFPNMESFVILGRSYER